ncbi:MAG: succinate dehydrogenase/fumarate reductase flavoprotein subunit, partial [Thermoplasmata archaeon]
MKLIDGYPEYMRESIEKVEDTRERRLKEVYRRMSMDEREEVLRKFHPDYDPKGKRKIRVGPNAGDVAPNEFVDLLEAEPMINEEDVDLSQIDYDV